MSNQNNSIETLQQDVDQVKTDLDLLKTETDELIKQNKVQAAAEKVKTTKEAINKKLNELKWLTDATSVQNSAKLEVMLNTLESLESSSDELKILRTTVTESSDEPVDDTGIDTPVETPPVIEKERNWIQRQRDGATSKEEWKTNTLTNVARVAWGIGAVALAVRWIKKLFGIGKDKEENNDENNENDSWNNDKEKNNEKSPRWKKALIWTWILWWTVWAGILWYKYRSEIKWWLLDLIGKNLTFEEAIIKVKSDLGGISESDLNVALGLEYIEARETIRSYWEEIKIDKKRKRVEWLDVSFSNYEEMIHAANIINYSKATYKWKCVSDTPFYITSAGGDIEVRLLDDYQREVISGEWIPVWTIVWWVVWSIWALVAGYFAWPKAWITVWLGSIPGGMALWHYVGDGRSTLAKICPKLADGIGKEKLVVCLNTIKGLTQWNQEYEPDDKTPLQKHVNNVIKEIEATEVDTDQEFDQQWNARNLKAEVDPNDSTSYLITSRWRLGQTKVKFIEWKGMQIEWLDIEFTDIKEWIRVANLTNKIKCDYAGKCTKNPFSYKSKWTTLWNPWLYATDWETNRNPSNWIPYRIISEEKLLERYPNLLKNIETKYIPYLHKMRSENNRSLWIIPNQ